jgi:hypothetical protein
MGARCWSSVAQRLSRSRAGRMTLQELLNGTGGNASNSGSRLVPNDFRIASPHSGRHSLCIICTDHPARGDANAPRVGALAGLFVIPLLTQTNARAAEMCMNLPPSKLLVYDLKALAPTEAVVSWSTLNRDIPPDAIASQHTNMFTVTDLVSFSKSPIEHCRSQVGRFAMPPRSSYRLWRQSAAHPHVRGRRAGCLRARDHA